MPDKLLQLLSAESALLIACLIWQVVSYVLVGELFARAACGFSFWRQHQRLPEAAFVLGLAVYGVLGYGLLLLIGEPKVIAPAIFFLCLLAWLVTRRAFPQEPSTHAFSRYTAFRSTPWGIGALAAIALLALLVGLYRVPWLVQMHVPAGVAVGTNIYPDEIRTIGIPLSLAAYGFPLRFPVATETIDSYPLAAFVYSAAQISWLRTAPLAVLIADSIAATAFYGLVGLLAATSAAFSAPARFLAVLSALVSVSFNLWNLKPEGTHPLFLKLWGYYQYNQLFSTVAWTPISGLLWVMNHALAFTAALAACLWFSWFRDRAAQRIAWAPALLLGCFAMGSGVDTALMSACAVGGMLAFSLVPSLARKRPPPGWFWPGAAVFAASLLFLIASNWATVTSQTTRPYFDPFQLATDHWHHLGITLSHAGPYFLLLLVGFVLTHARPGIPAYWWIPLLTGLGFSFVFVWHSIWFWRFSLAEHMLLGVLCAILVDRVRSAGARRIYLTVWALFLLPGLAQTGLSWLHALGTWKTPELAEAVRWIHAETPLEARVAEFRPAETSLIPDLAYLRAGNQAGLHVSEAHHPLIGYEAYQTRYSDLAAGIASNDYILSPVDDRFPSILESCGATPAFRNRSFLIHQVTDACRAALAEGRLAAPAAQLLEQYTIAAQIAAAQGDPSKLPDELLQRYVMLDPRQIGILRNRLEHVHWAEGRCSEAVRLLEPVVEKQPEIAEARYSLGFSLHCSHRDPQKAIAEYSVAMDLGYSEFWVRYHRGTLYYELSELRKARRDLFKARGLNPAHEGINELLRRPGLAR
jgi:tetratricopeptide (TPR) repeat protein